MAYNANQYEDLRGDNEEGYQNIQNNLHIQDEEEEEGLTIGNPPIEENQQEIVETVEPSEDLVRNEDYAGSREKVLFL